MPKKLPPEVQAIVSASDAGFYATTVQLLKSYLENNPESQRGWIDYGHALGNLARYREAEAAYHRAIELTAEPDRDSIYGELGNLFRNEGNYEIATQWYCKQIEANPKDATGHVFLGSLEIKRGEFASAIEILQEGLECETVCFEELHFALGNAYRSLEEFTLAKVHYDKAIAADPKYDTAKTALKDVKNAISEQQKL